MTPELQKYYEDRFSMMSTPGWTALLEDIEEIMTSINDISVLQDEKQLQFKKGELSILRWLHSLKQVSEQAYEGLQN
jgi:hypothetical protein